MQRKLKWNANPEKRRARIKWKGWEKYYKLFSEFFRSFQWRADLLRSLSLSEYLWFPSRLRVEVEMTGAIGKYLRVRVCAGGFRTANCEPEKSPGIMTL